MARMCKMVKDQKEASPGDPSMAFFSLLEDSSCSAGRGETFRAGGASCSSLAGAARVFARTVTSSMIKIPGAPRFLEMGSTRSVGCFAARNGRLRYGPGDKPSFLIAAELCASAEPCSGKNKEQ